MSNPTLGLVGLGKIARDQHLPAIAATGRFDLAGLVSPDGLPDGLANDAALAGVPCFRSQAAMLAALPRLDAVAICTPPDVRHGLTVEALRAGKHALIEKPPAATVSELHDLAAEATAAGRTLFTAWHSQFNPAVDAARERLAGRGIRRLTVDWKEDVRRWHPGQDWIFAAGGFGGFDPGINALSILTRILPVPVFVRAAELLVPENRDTPIAATLDLKLGQEAPGIPSPDRAVATFDFRQEGEQTWAIAVETADGTRLDLTRGGARLAVDGVVAVDEPDTEYRRIYDHFRRLVDDGVSDVDAAPLHLVADACAIGRHRTVAAFDW